MEENYGFCEHMILREEFEWGTYGKSGNEPLRQILLKDITDPHLDNIIVHLNSSGPSGRETMRVMVEERAYRLRCGIEVIEKPDFKNFKFGR